MRRLLADEPAQPLGPAWDWQAEVERRSGGLRRRRRVRRLEAAALAAAVVVLGVALAGAPTERRVRSEGPADTPPGVVEAGGTQPEGPATGSARPSTAARPKGRMPASSPTPAAGVQRSEPARGWRVLVVDERGLVDMASDGTDARVLSQNKPDTARWSPDQTMIAMGTGGSISMLRPATGHVWSVFSADSTRRGYDPDWMPDGLSVVFRHESGLPQPSFSLARVGFAGGEPVLVPVAITGAPKVASDGRVAHMCGDFELCLTDVTGADRGRVAGVRYAYDYNWSEDGRWLALTQGPGPTHPLAVIRPDGSERRDVVSDGSQGAPHWVSDGSGLVFEMQRPDKCPRELVAMDDCDDSIGHVYSVQADGSGLRQITGRPARLLDVRPG